MVMFQLIIREGRESYCSFLGFEYLTEFTYQQTLYNLLHSLHSLIKLEQQLTENGSHQ